MKKRNIIVGAVVALGALAYCGSVSNDDYSSTPEENVAQDTVKAEEEDSVEIEWEEDNTAEDESIINRKEFLERFYRETFVVENGMFDYEDQHLSCMSQEMIDMLRDNYDYECEDGNCYGWWVFRDPSQDGPDVPTISISYDEGDWFNVHYVGGETVDLKVRVEGDAQDITITGLKNPSLDIDVE